MLPNPLPPVCSAGILPPDASQQTYQLALTFLLYSIGNFIISPIVAAVSQNKPLSSPTPLSSSTLLAPRPFANHQVFLSFLPQRCPENAPVTSELSYIITHSHYLDDFFSQSSIM